MSNGCTWQDHKGPMIVDGPTGDAGQNLNDNFVALADRAGSGLTLNSGTSC